VCNGGGVAQGLCVTVLLLLAFQRALPALPISISLALAFYFASTHLVVPFGDRLVRRQVFI